jgi:hypothetical protein
VFIADTGNHVVRVVPARDASIHLLAGRPGVAGFTGDVDLRLQSGTQI